MNELLLPKNAPVVAVVNDSAGCEKNKKLLTRQEKEATAAKSYFDQQRKRLGDLNTFAKVNQFKPDEDATCIEIAVFLKKDFMGCYIYVPILTILSCFIFPLFLYHSVQMQANWFYKRNRAGLQASERRHPFVTIENATSLLVISRGKILATKFD